MHRVANFYNRIFTWSTFTRSSPPVLLERSISGYLLRYSGAVLALFEKNLSLEIALPASFLLLYFAALLLAVSAVLWFS